MCGGEGLRRVRGLVITALSVLGARAVEGAQRVSRILSKSCRWRYLLDQGRLLPAS